LLLIAYLQSTGHLPNLQDPKLVSQSQLEHSYLWLRPPKSNQAKLQVERSSNSTAGRLCCDTTFTPSVPEVAQWKQTPMDPGTALWGFFAYYAGFDFEHRCVSINTGGFSPRPPFKAPASGGGLKAINSSAFANEGWQDNL
jgi:hypothetical protein